MTTVETRTTRSLLGVEVLIVLALTLGQSAVYSILRIIERLTREVALNQQTSTLNPSVVPDRPWLDFTYQVVQIAFGLVPVALVIYLIQRSDPPASRTLGLGRITLRPDVIFGLLITIGIGIPGLGLYLLARALNLNTEVQASGLTATWWTIPVLILSAVQNALLEETIMIGYLFTRLSQLNWRWPVILIVSALLRGTYHLYQGFGGFVGNTIMGVIFGLIYLRWRRLWPLVIAHTLLDVVAFVGYALLAPQVDWL
jgi:membrane protease YdiL (CAAX protease family)